MFKRKELNYKEKQFIIDHYGKVPIHILAEKLNGNEGSIQTFFSNNASWERKRELVWTWVKDANGKRKGKTTQFIQDWLANLEENLAKLQAIDLEVKEEKDMVAGVIMANDDISAELEQKLIKEFKITSPIVTFNDTAVGKVVRVEMTDKGLTADISLNEEGVREINKVHGHSVGYIIVDDPLNANPQNPEDEEEAMKTITDIMEKRGMGKEPLRMIQPNRIELGHRRRGKNIPLSDEEINYVLDNYGTLTEKEIIKEMGWEQHPQRVMYIITKYATREHKVQIEERKEKRKLADRTAREQQKVSEDQLSGLDVDILPFDNSEALKRTLLWGEVESDYFFDKPKPKLDNKYRTYYQPKYR